MISVPIKCDSYSPHSPTCQLTSSFTGTYAYLYLDPEIFYSYAKITLLEICIMSFVIVNHTMQMSQGHRQVQLVLGLVKWLYLGRSIRYPDGSIGYDVIQ